MRAGEITHHSVAQQARHHRVLINHLLGRSAPKAHDDDVIDRFGRVDALVRVVDAEAVPAKAELGNMTPPIGEQLADPNRSRDHLVPAFRLVAFGINLVITAEAEPRADPLQRDHGIKLAGFRDTETVVCRSREPAAVSGIANLPVHGFLRPCHWREDYDPRARTKLGMILRDNTYVKLLMRSLQNEAVAALTPARRVGRSGIESFSRARGARCLKAPTPARTNSSPNAPAHNSRG